MRKKVREAEESTRKKETIHRDTSPPGPHNVICALGGKVNSHTGNVSFWEDVRKLR